MIGRRGGFCWGCRTWWRFRGFLLVRCSWGLGGCCALGPSTDIKAWMILWKDNLAPDLLAANSVSNRLSSSSLDGACFPQYSTPRGQGQSVGDFCRWRSHVWCLWHLLQLCRFSWVCCWTPWGLFSSFVGRPVRRLNGGFAAFFSRFGHVSCHRKRVLRTSSRACLVLSHFSTLPIQKIFPSKAQHTVLWPTRFYLIEPPVSEFQLFSEELRSFQFYAHKRFPLQKWCYLKRQAHSKRRTLYYCRKPFLAQSCWNLLATTRKTSHKLHAAAELSFLGPGQ